MEIVGRYSMVNVDLARERQTWEGRYIFPPAARALPDERKVEKTTLRCTLCQRRYLRKLLVRPKGRVIRVEGQPNAQLQQPVIYDPLPRSMVALLCTSQSCRDVVFAMPHWKYREMTAANPSTREKGM